MTRDGSQSSFNYKIAPLFPSSPPQRPDHVFSSLASPPTPPSSQQLPPPPATSLPATPPPPSTLLPRLLPPPPSSFSLPCSLPLHVTLVATLSASWHVILYLLSGLFSWSTASLAIADRRCRSPFLANLPFPVPCSPLPIFPNCLLKKIINSWLLLQLWPVVGAPKSDCPR